MKAARVVTAVLASFALVTAGCSSSGGGPTIPDSSSHPSTTRTASPPRPTTARLGQPFANRGFRITVTKIVLNQGIFPGASDDTNGDPAAQPRPRNGQFVLAYLDVTNTETTSQNYDNAALSTITDTGGKHYAECECDIEEQDVESRFRAEQQPGMTVHGILAFDVPASVNALTTITIQPESATGAVNAPTVVSLT